MGTATLVNSTELKRFFEALLGEELIDQDTIENMKSWEHSGFQIYAGEAISGTDENARLFLARYLKKSPVPFIAIIALLEIDDRGFRQGVFNVNTVIGRFKTSHRWALQNQPGLTGFLITIGHTLPGV